MSGPGRPPMDGAAAAAAADAVEVVVPTVGRPSLARLVEALAQARVDGGVSLCLVDDRRDPDGPLPGLGRAGEAFGGRVRVLRGRGAGPAAARNLGWRTADAAWIAFLDDDVVPQPDWGPALRRDLADAGPAVAGTQGRLVVPAPAGRRPTDWERNVAGLQGARWATADMAYRRSALAAVGGFDERFPRAYREDADLALRVLASGWNLVRGRRRTHHPVGPAGPWVSVRLQAGNADDMLMRALHGRDWRARAGVPRGRRPRHLAITAAGLAAAALAGAGRPRAAAVAGAAWAAGTAELAWARIAPGPRTAREVSLMVATSAAIPPLATWHAARGLAGLRRRLRDRAGAPAPARGPRPRAVLFDRDGTLVVDVPYNGDPSRVRLMPGVGDAVARLRRARIPTGVVSNQSGIARGLIDMAQVEAVNARIEELLGDMGPWALCPHGPDDGCRCRKPQPGLVIAVARALGVPAGDCAVIGDIGADVDAARGAGARAVLVPTPRTRRDEIARAPEVAPDVPAAVEMLLGAGA